MRPCPCKASSAAASTTVCSWCLSGGDARRGTLLRRPRFCHHRTPSQNASLRRNGAVPRRRRALSCASEALLRRRSGASPSLWCDRFAWTLAGPARHCRVIEATSPCPPRRTMEVRMPSRRLSCACSSLTSGSLWPLCPVHKEARLPPGVMPWLTCKAATSWPRCASASPAAGISRAFGFSSILWRMCSVSNTFRDRRRSLGSTRIGRRP
mmetsp:Transcript_42952/g.118799  ORF Transcript_42952/g.118799 Transcript_42952/m.118799 type:complete len:210 (+) Transcript_42952:126-755(+)